MALVCSLLSSSLQAGTITVKRARNKQEWARAHDTLYGAIREVDPETIIVMEGGYKLEFELWSQDGFFLQTKVMQCELIFYSLHF